MSKRVAIYTRVSTNGQTTENQRRELKAVARRSSWKVVGIYEDAGISGAKGRDKRPEFDRLLKDATARKFDTISVFSLDRIGRSMQHLVTFLGEIRALGVDLFVLDQHLDTSTPMGEMVFHVAGAFAQFERRLIQERVKAGLQRARANGKHLGRPTVVDRRIRNAVNRGHDAGQSNRAIARKLKVSEATVRRVLAATA